MPLPSTSVYRALPSSATATGYPLATSYGAAALQAPASGAPEEPGYIETAIEGLTSAGPELLTNAVATKANHSELGQQVEQQARAPLSFFGTLAVSALALLTRGAGDIGKASVKVALGLAHATVAHISRPAVKAAPVNGVEGIAPSTRTEA